MKSGVRSSEVEIRAARVAAEGLSRFRSLPPPLLTHTLTGRIGGFHPSTEEFAPRWFPKTCATQRDHEVRVAGDRAAGRRHGNLAADQLGDIVFVELPAVERVCRLRRVGPTFGVESVKAVSDLFSPLSGVVTETNPALAGQPELVNGDPYGEGWMVKLKVADSTELAELLDPAAYDQLIAEA